MAQSKQSIIDREISSKGLTLSAMAEKIAGMLQPDPELVESGEAKEYKVSSFYDYESASQPIYYNELVLTDGNEFVRFFVMGTYSRSNFAGAVTDALGRGQDGHIVRFSTYTNPAPSESSYVPHNRLMDMAVRSAQYSDHAVWI
jgi:hypothetical protein